MFLNMQWQLQYQFVVGKIFLKKAAFIRLKQITVKKIKKYRNNNNVVKYYYILNLTIP